MIKVRETIRKTEKWFENNKILKIGNKKVSKKVWKIANYTFRIF